MERKNFQKMVAYLAAAYDEEVTRDRAGVYWHQLASLPDEPFAAAVYDHVSHSRYFPTVADLIEATQAQMRRREPIEVPQLQQQRGSMNVASKHLTTIKRKLGRRLS